MRKIRQIRTNPCTTSIIKNANNGSPATSVANETNRSTSVEAKLLPLTSHTKSDSADKNNSAAASDRIAVIGLTELLIGNTLALLIY
jgi:hypothetical protein